MGEEGRGSVGYAAEGSVILLLLVHCVATDLGEGDGEGDGDRERGAKQFFPLSCCSLLGFL